MKTQVFKDDLQEAAELIAKGGLVAVPTETVYGLAGNGLDEDAVKKIYEVKGRPERKPLSLMVHDMEAIDRYCLEAPGSAKILAKKYWPGPLTIVMKAKSFIPAIVLSGGDTVGLRCPDHPLTLELLRLSGLPFAAPSANPSGMESPKTAQKVLEYFDGQIPAVVDGGECGIGKESTIIDMSTEPYKILRHGALATEDIADTLADNIAVIGITGGTGCGKTTALEQLENMGALVIDCDALYHQLLQSDRELLRELAHTYPGAIVEGELDRKALGAIVFADEAALLELNRITHRHIMLEIQRKLRDFAMAGGKIAAIDAIELISSGIGERCQCTVAICAAPEKRVERIMARDGISRDYAVMRIQAQKPEEYFRENCDYVLYNNDSSEQFMIECRKLFEEVLNHG